MKQYLVQMFQGYVEEQTVASIDFFVAVREDRNPTQIADAFKRFLKIELIPLVAQHEQWLSPDAAVYFKRIFGERSHEFGFDWQYFDSFGWKTQPHPGVPLTKVVSLQAMDLFLSDDPEDQCHFRRDGEGEVYSGLFHETDLTKKEDSDDADPEACLGF